MEPFRRLTSVAIPLPAANVDTDVIFPARFLLITSKAGLARYAFHDWRADDPEFVLNQGAYAGARIIIAGNNFGCGSSREQAPWALRDLGLRCLIATSFGEIFQSNCLKNGLLAITVTPEHQQDLLADAQARSPITVDLEAQLISRANGADIEFPIEPWRREALLSGWDEIAIVLNQDVAAIGAFERRQRAEMPWLYLGE
jgi:3-isopropylmalate dehydratase small subunit